MSAVTPPSSAFPTAGLFPPRLKRLGLLFAGPFCLALLVVARLVQFQVFLYNQQNASRFVARNLPTVATRGVIADARGELLAGDVWTYRFVLPRLEAMPSHYRDIVAHLLAGIAQRATAPLHARMDEALAALGDDRTARRSPAAASNDFAYVVLADDLHLVQGQYLENLQTQGVTAANLWDLHLRGDDKAYTQLQALLAPDAAAEAAAPGAPQPDLQQVMQNLGLRADLAVSETDFDFFRHFQLEIQPSRYYTQSTLGSHVLGLVNAERNGVNGLESYYQKFLRGQVSLSGVAEPLSALTPEARRYVPSHMGGDLVITIDRTIQFWVEQELQLALERYNVQQGGAIIVMEPDTGAILAMANRPDFDPAALARQDPAATNFTNLAVTGVYEPGSVFKVLTVATGLDADALAPQDEFFDIGTYAIGPEAVIRNSEDRTMGRVTATEALAFSLNTIMAEIAVERIGPETFYDYLFDYGLGEVTGIDLAHEFNGSLKDKYPGTINWNITDLGANSFGQGINLTPIQMINALNVVASGGQLMKPYVVRHRVNGNGVATYAPTVLRNAVLRPETVQAVTDMMVFTVEEAVVKAQVAGYRVAGKSGTAQVPDPDRIGAYDEEMVIASFAGFAPASDPRIIVLIKLNDPRFQDGTPAWGSQNAAPTFSRIAERILDYLNVPPACHPDCYASPPRASAPAEPRNAPSAPPRESSA